MIVNCGPDGVACGLHAASSPLVPPGSPSYEDPAQWNAERSYYVAVNRQAAMQSIYVREERARILAEAGISEADYARAQADAHKTKWDVIKEVAWEILKDISGWCSVLGR
ncbi:hypothetical protein [Actinosynnema sp. NPDC020468]|uniref:hypothetical protein n=1 Tax=Actinosynnema sp. NPDC020468 TaxID=3154488 RepID=UPI0033F86FC4